MPPLLKPLNVSDEERAALQAWTCRRKTAQQMALRSGIVLRASKADPTSASLNT